jgi:hypothetical protein
MGNGTSLCLYIKPKSRYILYLTILVFNFKLVSTSEINIHTKEIMPMIRKKISKTLSC